VTAVTVRVGHGLLLVSTTCRAAIVEAVSLEYSLSEAGVPNASVQVEKLTRELHRRIRRITSRQIPRLVISAAKTRSKSTLNEQLGSMIDAAFDEAIADMLAEGKHDRLLLVAAADEKAELLAATMSAMG